MKQTFTQFPGDAVQRQAHAGTHDLTLLALKNALLVGVLLALLAVSPMLPALALAGLSLWALSGSRQAIQSLTLVVLIRGLNPALYSNEGGVALLGWLAIAAATLGVLRDANRSPRFPMPPMRWLLLYGAVVLTLSLFYSLYPLVSVFKILSFVCTFATILAGFAITHYRGVDWAPWFLGVWIAVIVLSLFTLPAPQVAYQRDGLGFQGILDQPQALAIFIAPMLAWLFGKLFLSHQRRDIWLFGLAAVTSAQLFMTRGRTGLVAISAGLIAVLLLMLLVRTNWTGRLFKALLHPLTLAALYGTFALLIMMQGAVSEFMLNFTFKNLEGATLADAFQKSRGFLVEESWENFLAAPWTGIGFGVSNSQYFPFNPQYEPITGLPLGASTEKPNLAVAVLEETGIIGAAFFLLLLMSLIRQVARNNDVALAWAFFAGVFTNVAEVIFFSSGGLGLYLLLIIGWVTATNYLPAHRVFRRAG